LANPVSSRETTEIGVFDHGEGFSQTGVGASGSPVPCPHVRANRYRLFRKNAEAISNLLIIMAQPDYIDRAAAASGEAMASGQHRRLLSSTHQNKKSHGRSFE
jgi:hypothetical protein